MARPATTTMHRLAARARRAFGLFGALWLAVSTPCAMAFGGGHDCPHCPTEVRDAGEGHHGHHGDAPAERGCDSLQSACGDLDEVSLDGRGSQAKGKNPLESAAAPVPTIVGHSIVRATDRYPTTDPPIREYSPPPLNLLFCVFLD